MKFNPNKKIVDLRGREIPKSFPSSEEIEVLEKDSMERLDKSKLPHETIANMIINCLSNYVVWNGKEGFYVGKIAQKIIDAEDKKKDVELSKKYIDFLDKVLDQKILKMTKDKNGTEKTEGLYVAWAIWQVKEEIGVLGKE